MPRTLTVVLAVLAAGPAAGQFTFTRVAEIGTTAAGGTTEYNGFDPAVLTNGAVSFRALNDNFGSIGVYRAAAGGPVTRVAHTSTAVPSGSGNFTDFSSLSAGAGRTAFVGSAPFATFGYGVYSTSGGTLDRVVDLSTPVPGGGTFSRFNRGTAISGGTTYFSANKTDNTTALYSATGGTVTKLVDATTPMPGTAGNFTFAFQPAAMAGGAVAFGGRNDNNVNGVYTLSGGSVARVADTNTAVPQGSGLFTGVAVPAAAGTTVAFSAYSGTANTPTGVYAASDGGALVRVADLGTALPGLASVGGFGTEVSFSGGWVAFTATLTGDPSGANALYLRDAAGTGAILKVVGVGDVIDGRTIGRVDFGRYGLDGDRLTFNAYFTDGPYPGLVSVYTVLLPVPEPAAGLLVAAAVLAVRRRSGICRPGHGGGPIN